jgi:hypothetical protein
MLKTIKKDMDIIFAIKWPNHILSTFAKDSGRFIVSTYILTLLGLWLAQYAPNGPRIEHTIESLTDSIKWDVMASLSMTLFTLTLIFNSLNFKARYLRTFTAALLQMTATWGFLAVGAALAQLTFGASEMGEFTPIFSVKVFALFIAIILVILITAIPWLSMHSIIDRTTIHQLNQNMKNVSRGTKLSISLMLFSIFFGGLYI